MIGISVKDLAVSFGETKILEDISFSVEAGEIVTILGPSGCGKSTILRCIASLHDNYKGEIFLNETCLVNDGGNQCNKDIGYIFQDYALFPHLNVRENIEFALYKLKQDEKQRRVDVLLKQFDLFDHRHKQIHELSGGQQQRVSIARVLAYEPKVLLLDEPFSNLDTILRNKTKVWLKKMIKELGLSAILVTHDQKEALSMSDKIAIINDKKIEQFGTAKELFEKPKSYYIANFLNRINKLPTKLIENLGSSITPENLAVIPIDKIEVTADSSKIEASILDISYCGDYYELEVSLDNYDNLELTVKSFCIDCLTSRDKCYLDIDLKDIQIVREKV